MTEQDLVLKNLTLSREFDLYLIEHLEVTERIPAHALIVLLPEDDPNLCAKNQELARVRREPGQPVVSVRVGVLTPPSLPARESESRSGRITREKRGQLPFKRLR